ncbi:SpoIIE family protein phosphatase [candidate division CSSED10-310 bacterium]|uniref:SpoIIE family protein phosphatase n=1 Tax=candidate division CSSED10-310 bacterium TaxID=2855610 RepID=A0ABV6YXM3_UNCC1
MVEEKGDHQKKRGVGIGFKMSATVVTLLVFLFFMMSFLFILDQKKVITQTMERNSVSLASSIAKNCENALIANDYLFLEMMTDEMIKNENILYMIIIKPGGEVLAHSDKNSKQTNIQDKDIINWKRGTEYSLRSGNYLNKPCFIISVPIYAKGIMWGFVQIGNSLIPLQETLQRAYFNSITIAICFIILGIVIVLILTKRLTIPLLHLTQGAREIGAGNLDYQIKSSRGDELGLLADTFNQMAVDLKISTEQLEESKKLERELELAYQIQQSLLPKALPKTNGIEVSAFCKPAQVVGGDFYDFLNLPDKSLGIVIGDVSGKSIQSALYMAITQSIIRSEADRELSPRKVLVSTNHHLAAALSKNAFVTLFYMVINRKNGEVTYASAGHNPMLLLKPDQKDILLIKSRGYPLGVDEKLFNDRIEEKKFRLDQNDLLVLFTDGIIEAMNPQQQEFSLERFLSLVKSQFFSKDLTLEKLNDTILREIQVFSQGMLQHDDITLVTLRMGENKDTPDQ